MRRYVSHRLLYDGERIPYGWGVAYEEPALRAVVLYPIPLHWIIKWLRLAYWWGISRKPNKWENILRDAHKQGNAAGFARGQEKGWNDGYKEGTLAGYKQKKEEIKTAFQIFEAESRQREVERWP